MYGEATDKVQDLQNLLRESQSQPMKKQQKEPQSNFPGKRHELRKL